MSDLEDSREGSGSFEELLRFIRDSRGFDLASYKRASLTRRVRKRMGMVGVDDYAAYRERLSNDPREFTALFNTILINVTAFLRDRDAWDYLGEAVLPRLAERDPAQTIRAWCAGCASGEEAYSLAVLLCDVLGEERFRQSVKIYGTDADEEVLVQARHGRYPTKALREAFDDRQLAEYFESDDDGTSFRADLRRSLIFGRHDLVRDPPISRVDLLICRNTLMYFNTDVQQRVLRSFHFGLNPGGYLFLGKSEALVTRTNLFAVEELTRHVFTKPAGRLSSVAGLAPPALDGPVRPPVAAPLVDAAFESAPVALVVVDRVGTLMLVNRRGRQFFGLGQQHIGRPFRDLNLSYRPAELRGRIGEAIEERRPAVLNGVEMTLASGASESLDIHVVPVVIDGAVVGVSLTFEEIGRYQLLQEELERSQRELEAAYEELQSTVEELETTNEELQSTNEELETTNEELHSSNEELETMNEELQSTNEELETINNELRIRSGELDELSSFLQTILSSLRSGVVVLNPSFGVRVWNRESENLWGLRSEEVEGHHFLNLDIGLPVQELRDAIRGCLNRQSDGEQVTLEAVNRRGKSFECRVSVFPLQRDGSSVDGVILLMEDAIGSREEGAG